MSIVKVREILVPVDEAKTIENYLTAEPSSAEECLPEDKAYTYTADFGDGWQMDIKVCGLQFEEGGGNTAWSEAVLFKDGVERCCSDPSEDLLGDWELEADGITFVTKVAYKPDHLHCPHCGSEDVETSGIGEFDGEYFYNPVNCYSCGCSYMEAYKFDDAWVTRLDD